MCVVLQTKEFVRGVSVASQEEGIPTHASTQTQRVLSSEIFAGGHTTQVEPSITLNTGGVQDFYPAPGRRRFLEESQKPRITLNTGGAQDFYPALGRRRLLHKSQKTLKCRTQRRTPSAPCHPDNDVFHCAHQPMPPLL